MSIMENGLPMFVLIEGESFNPLAITAKSKGGKRKLTALVILADTMQDEKVTLVHAMAPDLFKFYW
jgi:hypothetical protein